MIGRSWKRTMFFTLRRICINRSFSQNLLRKKPYLTRKMSCEEVSAAFITCPNIETAKALARRMVEENIVACVNLIPNVSSIYSWENKVEEDTEVMMLIKTRTTKIQDVNEFIKTNHPYDVPEVISFKIDGGNPAYLDFVRANTIAKSVPPGT